MMNRKKPIIILLTIMLILGLFYGKPISIHSADENVFTNTELIVINNSTNITLSAAAPLTWVLNEPTNLTISARLTAIAENDSLYITYFASAYNLPEQDFAEDQKTTIVKENLTEIDQEIKKTQTRYAPEGVDTFNITITILAQTTNMTESQQYSIDFPGRNDENISIKKDLVLPIINLPGFPNLETFVRWIIIFLILFVILISPAALVGYFKLKEWGSKRNKTTNGGKTNE